MSVNAGDFRAALGRWASGVSVVTCSWEHKLHGMTVSAFSSISLSPPLVAVCLAADARTLLPIQESGWFAVNILAEEQAAVSEAFASRGEESERFRGVKYTLGAHNLPLIDGSTAQIICQVEACHSLGDHVLVVGHVALTQASERPPLLYHLGRYGRFAQQ